jgi:hypothetical protein
MLQELRDMLEDANRVRGCCTQWVKEAAERHVA